jgi:hypothetical protein
MSNKDKDQNKLYMVLKLNFLFLKPLKKLKIIK